MLPARLGPAHDSIPTYRSFQSGDGSEIVITANTERMWQSLCKVLGLEALTTHLDYRTNQDRYRNRTTLWPLLEEAFRKRGAGEWVARLEDEGIPVGVVNTLDRVMSDPQVRHRGMVMTLAADDGRKAQVVGDPIHFGDGNALKKPSYPPALGEHTVEVLRDVLGMADEEISVLLKSGIVQEPTSAAKTVKPE